MAARKKTKKAVGGSRTRKPKRSATRGRTARPARRATPRAKGLSLQSAGPSYTVDDLEKSLAFYRDVLECAIGERWERDGRLLGVELKAGKVTFWLSQDDWKKGRGRAKGDGFRIYCETRQDVDRLAAGIKARGGRLSEEPHDEPWGGRSFTVADPDGFKLTITRA
jgi:catechol 2,3-dioxygenase-like lactoylglutathione lyase family enzyme